MHSSLDLVQENLTLNFFGVEINIKLIINAYNIFKRGINITPNEKKILDDLENFMYTIYDSHRDEMIKNNS